MDTPTPAKWKYLGPKPGRIMPVALGILILGVACTRLTEVATGGEPSEGAKPPALTDRMGDPLPLGAVARLGTIRLRQVGSVERVVFSPDGKTIASCTYYGEVRLWDAATGLERCKVWDTSSDLRCITFSADGKTLAGAGHGKSIHLWDVATAKEVVMEAPVSDISWTSFIAFSPNGKLLATAGAYEQVLIWDLAERKVIHKIDAKRGGASSLVFSQDGNLLAWVGASSSGDESAIHLWDMNASKLARQLKGHKKAIPSLCFSADSKTLASGSWDKTVRLWNVKTGEESRQITTWGESVAFSPDGETLASGDHRGSIHLWDPSTGKERLSIFAGGIHVESLSFSKNGKQLASASGTSAIGLWNVATGEAAVPALGHRQAVHDLAFSPDGKKLATRGGDNTARMWDVASAKQLHQYEIIDWEKSSEGFVSGRLSFLPDGKTLAVLGTVPGSKCAQFWDLATDKRATEIRGDLAAVTCMNLSPDGRILAFAGYGGIELRRVETGKELRSFSLLGGGNTDERHQVVAFSPDGHTLGSACNDKKIHLWDWTTGTLLFSLDSQQREIHCLAFSPDGQMLATCGTTLNNESDGTIYLWDVTSRTLIRKLEGHKGQVHSVAFSPDLSTLASAGVADKTVRVWNAFTGKELAKFEGHTGAVTCVGFSPDGKLLASGSADTTVLLWDVSKIDRGIPAAKIGPDELKKLWAALADEDRAKAYAAVPGLTGAGDGAAAFLKDLMKPAPEADAKRIAKLIANLDSGDFDVRESASKELAKIGAAAEPFLKKALEGKPSEEARMRLESLLPEGKAPVTNAEGLRELRAVMVLERIGTKAAREVLEALANGAPDARLTRNAKLSLARLDRKAAK